MFDIKQTAVLLAILVALLVLAGSHGPDLVSTVASSDVVQQIADVQP